MQRDCEQITSCNVLPDACTNEVHEANVIQRQDKQLQRSFCTRLLERDRNLIIACVILAVAMNFQEGRWLLYPFEIFSVWVHELCHGLAAILTPGGRIAALRIFKDGSGLAYTATKTANAGTFVSSAGYPGTAVTGFLMLLFRRTTLGPTIGLIVLGVAMILSVVLYVKNDFGRWFLSAEAAVLLFFSWKMPAHYTDNLYNFLAATCCLNAVENVQDLFGNSYMVNGEEISGTDAHSTADGWGGDYRMWAMIWLWFSLGMTVLGIICGFDARRLPSCVRPSQPEATAVPYGSPTTDYSNMGTAVAYPVQGNTTTTSAAPQKKLHAAQIM